MDLRDGGGGPVMLVSGVLLLADGKECGWLMIVGAALMMISMVLLAREQRREEDR